MFAEELSRQDRGRGDVASGTRGDHRLGKAGHGSPRPALATPCLTREVVGVEEVVSLAHCKAWQGVGDPVLKFRPLAVPA